MMTVICLGQTNQKFNLDFENQIKETGLADGWIQWGNYILTNDHESYSGKKSGKITSSSNGNFGSIAYRIPAKYKGKTITLEGYMKIKNVTGGFAGLLLRIDGNGTTLVFDNMQRKNVSGTKDWEKYSITLEYPENGEQIYVAGILVGKGEAWFDDFVVSIDGQNVQTLKESEKVFNPAQQDKTFDKGSTISSNDLMSCSIDNLVLLGRVWGFLKYHHPAIAKGAYNWDYELFRFLSKYIKVKNEHDRNELLITWINNLGNIEECTNCKPTDKEAILKPNNLWMHKLHSSLKNKLIYIYKNRSQGNNYYIGKKIIGNPNFKNENAYYGMSYPDAGYRLLSIYRYWNMINYFFPYKHLTDKNWDNVLKEYIPVFIGTKDELSYEKAVIQLIGEIQDTHANLWQGGNRFQEWKGTNYAPIKVRFVENQLTITDFFNEDLKNDLGLKHGDVITRIDDVDIQDIIKENLKYYPASNIPTQLRDLAKDILRSNKENIKIEFKQKKETKVIVLPLYTKNKIDELKDAIEKESKSFKLLDKNIGYINLAHIKKEDISKIKEEFQYTDGIIIDIRNYPATSILYELGPYFVSSNKPFVKFTTANLKNPGEFTFVNTLNMQSTGKTYEGKVVILINELTLSHAEFTAMAFRVADNSIIIGSTTAGADGNVSEISLPGGLLTMISGIGVNYPDGKETQRVGIVPDIIIKPTIEGIRNRKDELLDKAIEIINN